MSKGKELTPKKLRREIRKFINILLSNMGFKDRLKFIFKGNYYGPLKKTFESLNRKGEIFEEIL